jgi:hypothetical protein
MGSLGSGLAQMNKVSLLKSVSTYLPTIVSEANKAKTSSGTAIKDIGTGLQALNGVKISPSIPNQLGNLIEKFNNFKIPASTIANIKEFTSALTPLQSLQGVKLSGLSSAVNAANKSVGAGASIWNDWRTKMVAAYQIIPRITSAIGGWIKESNAYVENLNLFTAIMGEFASEAQKYAEEVSEVMGIDPSEWIRNQGVFQAITTGFGVAADKAAIMSKNMTQLGYDISSFFNLPFEEAFRKLQSGIAGELEPLRRLGYDLSQVRLQQEATNLGIKTSVSDMNQATKSMLRYHAIMTQLPQVQGDMARTLQAPANQLRIFQSQVTLLSRALGNVFIPMLNAILPYAIAFVKAIRLMAQSIANLFGFKLPEIDYSGMKSGAAAVSDGMDSAADAADGTAKGMGKAAKNAKSAAKAAKKIKDYTMGIDKLNIINEDTVEKEKTPSTGGGGGEVDIPADAFDIPLPEYDFLGELEKKADGLVGKMGTLAKVIGGVGLAFGAWKIATGIGAGLSAIKGGLDVIRKGTSPVIGGVDKVGKSVKGVGKAGKDLAKSGAAPWVTIGGGAKKANTPISKVKNGLSNIAKKGGAGFTKIGTGFRNIGTKALIASAGVGTIGDYIKKIPSIPGKIGGGFKTLGGNIGAAVSKFPGLLKNIGLTIASLPKLAFGAVTGALKNFGGAVKIAAGNLKLFALNTITAVKNLPKLVLGGITGGFKTLGVQIKTAALQMKVFGGKVVTTASNLPKLALTGVGKGLQGVGDAAITTGSKLSSVGSGATVASGGLKKMTTNFAGTGKAVTVASPKIAGFSKAAGKAAPPSLISNVGKFASKIGTVAAAAGPAAPYVAAVAAAAAGLTVAFVDAYKNSEETRKGLDAVKKGAIGAAEGIYGGVKSLLEFIGIKIPPTILDAFKGIREAWHNWNPLAIIGKLSEPVTDPFGDVTDGLSELEKTKIEPFLEDVKDLQKTLDHTYLKGDIITQENVDSVKAKTKEIKDAIKKELEQDQIDAQDLIKNLDTFATPAQKAAYSADIDEYYAKANKEVEFAEGQINKIVETAKNENRQLTKREYERINTLTGQMEEYGITAMSESEETKSRLMQKLSMERIGTSTTEAAKIIEEAQDMRDKTITAAQDTYSKQVFEAEKLKDAGIITQTEYDAMVKSAEAKRDAEIAASETAYDSIVEATKRGLGKNADQIDWETGKVRTKWDLVWGKIKGTVSGVVEGIKGFFLGIGGWFSDRWNDIKNAFSAVGTFFVNTFGENGAWGKIKGFFKGIGKWFSDRWNDITSAFSAVGTFFSDIGGKIWDGITGGIGDLAKWANDNIIKPVVTFFTNAPANLKDAGSSLLSTIGSGITDVGTWINDNLIQPIFTWIKGAPQAIKDVGWQFLVAEAKGFTNIGNWFNTNLIQPIFKWVKGAPKAIKDVGLKLLTSVGSGITSVATWFKDNVISPVLNGWSTILGKVKEIGGKLLTSVGSGITSVVTWFRDNVISPVTNKWSTIVDDVKKIGKRLIDGIAAGLGNIRTWVKDNIWDPMVKFFTDNPITAIFKPKTTTPSVSSVQAKAAGGFVTSGQMFIAREAGPEMVGRIGAKTAVANNDQIVAAISQGVAAAIAPFMGEDSQNFNITLKVDGKQIKTSIDKVTRDSGMSIYRKGGLSTA